MYLRVHRNDEGRGKRSRWPHFSNLFNVASGSIHSRKLWNMVHDQIVKEDRAVQEELEKEVSRLDQREKDLIQWSPTAPYSRPGGATSRPESRGILLPGENVRIKKQLAAAQEEKRVLIGRLHEIETRLLSSHGTSKTYLLWLIKNAPACAETGLDKTDWICSCSQFLKERLLISR